MDVWPEIPARGDAGIRLVDVGVERHRGLDVAAEAGLDQRRLDVLQRWECDLCEFVVVGLEKGFVSNCNVSAKQKNIYIVTKWLKFIGVRA